MTPVRLYRTLLTDNEQTIRKVLLAEMVLRKYGRDHPEFTEVFAVAYKGVQCAFVSPYTVLCCIWADHLLLRLISGEA